MPQLLAKFVPLVQTLILVGIDVRARSRFDRLTHHAHGHGGWIAAGGDVGSRFPVARSVDDGASATGVCIQMYTTSVLKAEPTPPLRPADCRQSPFQHGLLLPSPPASLWPPAAERRLEAAVLIQDSSPAAPLWW